MEAEFRHIAREGLWTNNPAMVQLLGLCPLLAVSGNFVTGLSLGITTLVILTASNTMISLLRGFLDENTRLPAQIMIIATFVTCADILLQGWLFGLHQRIALFVALIVTNCTLLGRAELFASRQPVVAAAWDGLMMGLGFLMTIVVLSSIREVLGHGTLFANMHLLFGNQAAGWTLTFSDSGFLLLVLPPGAFLVLGFMIAARNGLDLALAGSNERGEHHEQG